MARVRKAGNRVTTPQALGRRSGILFTGLGLRTHRKDFSVIDLRILIRALVVGTVLQVVMVCLAHFIPWVMAHVFEFGGMMISATTGYLYAMDSGKGYFPGAT